MSDERLSEIRQSAVNMHRNRREGWPSIALFIADCLADGCDELLAEIDRLKRRWAGCEARADQLERNWAALVGPLCDILDPDETGEVTGELPSTIIDAVRELVDAGVSRGEDMSEYDPATWPTPGQWIKMWNDAAPDRRLRIAQRVLDASAEAVACFASDHAGRLADAEAEINRRIPCARCGRPILPYDSKTRGNEDLDVCGRCAVAIAREVAWEERKLWMRVVAALLTEAGDHLDTIHLVMSALTRTLDGYAALIPSLADVEDDEVIMETVAGAVHERDRLRAEIADRDAETRNLRAERDALQAKVAAVWVIASDPDTISALERGYVGWLPENTRWLPEAVGYAADALRDIRAALNGDTP